MQENQKHHLFSLFQNFNHKIQSWTTTKTAVAVTSVKLSQSVKIQNLNNPFNTLAGHCSDRLRCDSLKSWTDRARGPLKTCLNSENSKESNERDKNIPSQLKVWEKSIFLHLPYSEANYYFWGLRLFQIGGTSGRFATTDVIQISTTRALYIQWTSCSNSWTYYFILHSFDIRNKNSHNDN